MQVILYCSVSGNYPVILSISLLSWQNTSEQKEVKDPAKDPQYAEPQIDAMRAQKDQVTQLITCPLALFCSCKMVKAAASEALP